VTCWGEGKALENGSLGRSPQKLNSFGYLTSSFNSNFVHIGTYVRLHYMIRVFTPSQLLQKVDDDEGKAILAAAGRMGRTLCTLI